MSGPKAVTLPKKKTKDTGGDQQQGAHDAAACEQIRERAYYKWEAAGCPCCDGVEFWLQAEAELNGETQPEGETSEA